MGIWIKIFMRHASVQDLNVGNDLLADLVDEVDAHAG